jgi:crossover junction endodeoxyribonuclease RuvC
VRGVLVLGAREAGTPVQEISPREVKMGVTGHGGASKEQVQFMIKSLLHLSEAPPADASDALAIAVCAFQRRNVHARG